MKLSKELEAAHGRLSRHNLEFLDYVSAHPECQERSTFEILDRVSARIGYPAQAWPTFVRRDALRRLGRLNVELCRLVKSVPRRVFGTDAEGLRAFYGLSPDHARVVAPALGNKEWVGGALARSDFYHTSAGFKCLELNVAANLGGWEGQEWSDTVLQVPQIARFIARSGIEPGSIDVLHHLISHLLGQALRKFRSSEINIAFLTWEPAERLVADAGERYRRILSQLGNVKGRLIGCAVEDLVERRGLLFVGDTRIHVLVDGQAGSAGADTYRCWIRGSVSLYNGLLAPVFTDKRNLALLSELVDSDLWSRDERQLIRTAIPWTRRVSAACVHPQATEAVTPEDLVARREELVLKPGTGMASKDVYLGVSTPQSEWVEVVARAFDEGTWIVQERQESLPHLYQHGASGCVPFDVVWSFFVFGETFGGVFLRMMPQSRGGPVSSARGSVDGWVFEVDDEPAKRPE